MLEELATAYVNQPEDKLTAIGYGLVILGAVVAGVTNKSKSELQRAPYFVYAALLLVVASTLPFVWLASFEAAAGGYLWVLVAVSTIGSVVFGYFIGIIAMARSRDVYGHARWAPLAFIPIANLVLLLRRSRMDQSINRVPTVPLMTGGVGVLTGFALLILGGVLTALFDAKSAALIESAERDPGSQAASLDILVKSRGIEQTLTLLASEVSTPQEVDEVTVLSSVEASGRTLSYVYVISAEADFLTDTFRSGLTRQNCGHEGLRQVIDAGASVRHTYLRRDGSAIGVVSINSTACAVP